MVLSFTEPITTILTSSFLKRIYTKESQKRPLGLPFPLASLLPCVRVFFNLPPSPPLAPPFPNQIRL